MMLIPLLSLFVVLFGTHLTRSLFPTFFLKKNLLKFQNIFSKREKLRKLAIKESNLTCLQDNLRNLKSLNGSSCSFDSY